MPSNTVGSSQANAGPLMDTPPDVAAGSVSLTKEGPHTESTCCAAERYVFAMDAVRSAVADR